MLARLAEFLERQPPVERRIYSFLLAITVLTLPCYLTGFVLLALSGPAAQTTSPMPPESSVATEAATAEPLVSPVRRATLTPLPPALPTDTLPPTETAVPSSTSSPTPTWLATWTPWLPTLTPTWEATATLVPTDTAMPTLEPTEPATPEPTATSENPTAPPGDTETPPEPSATP